MQSRVKPVGVVVSFLALSFVLGCGLIPPRPAWEVPAPAPIENAIIEADDLHRITLPNGVRLLLLEDHRLPRVSLGITLTRGAGSVDPEFAGVADLATEVMQRGAGDRDALQLAKVVEDAGASLSISSGWDTTTISLSGLSEDRALLLEILTDVAFRPRFEQSEFAKAQAEQQAGIVGAQDDPATLVRWHALRTLFPGHRYGKPRTGTAESVAGIDVERARAYWEDRFIAESVIVWAVGDFSAKTLLQDLRRMFGDMPEGTQIAGIPPTPARTPASRRIVIVDKPDLLQARIIVGHEGIARTESTRIAVDLMNNALGGSGFSSRLMQTIRSKEGLTYGVGSGFSLRSQPGPFSVSTFTRVAKVRRVLDLIFAEMKAIQSDRPVDENELRKFIGYNVGRFGLSLETSDAILSSLVNLEVHGLPEDSLDTYRSRVRQVSIQDIADAAKLRLHPERAAIIIVGPAEVLAPELEDLGEIEIRQP
jgi:zinc protease